MPTDFISAHHELWSWVRAHDFAGHDPYDGLNSSLFQATPLRHSRAARLAWTQFLKRSSINLRKIAGVPAERNAKGIALFALAAIADYRRLQTKEAEVTARELLDDLIGMGLKGWRGACWGYNFDWQSRSFFAPKGAPTIIPTAFAARALCEAAEVIDRDEYLPFARTICDFILNDLNQSDATSEEVCFSYSPLDQTRVFNASLMAAEVLATVGGMLREQSLCEGAMRATRYVVRRQLNDGSWAYGADGHQTWSDNFHTGFILTSLSRIMKGCEAGDEIEPALAHGFEFWKERFFLSNGWPKYYPNRLYPADIHSTAAAIVTLVELRGRFPGTLGLAERIAGWSIENMRSSEGYFYYQRHRFHTTRIPYMRWSQAWMVYAISQLLEGKR
jgi:hypothetical protein